MMPRYRLTIAYEGTEFHGWQKQALPSPENPQERRPLRTVQHVVEQAIREVVREPIRLHGASRTDAGVHAAAQTAAFTVPVARSEEKFVVDGRDAHPTESDSEATSPSARRVWEKLTDDRLRLAVNSRVPDDVTIVSLARTRDDFDPIGDCLAKGYRYSICAGLDRPLWDRRYVHQIRSPLDLAKMREAAARCVGRRDFAAFAAAGHGRLSTVRTVLSCDVSECGLSEPPSGGPTRLGEPCHHAPGRRYSIDISGDGFLHNMVRIIAGTIVEAGRGRFEPDQMEKAIRSGDRRDAGPTLPAKGLCLMWMRYRGE